MSYADRIIEELQHRYGYQPEFIQASLKFLALSALFSRRIPSTRKTVSSKESPSPNALLCSA